MIKVRNTPQLAGITILGDYEDLKALYNAISNYTKLYLDHQDNVNAGHCYESILGLCYDLRHAWQGDRGYEALENNAAQLGSMASVLYELPAETENIIEEARDLYANGNLYFTVEVLHPWAIYYMFTLQAITDDYFKDEWFEDFDYKYDKYQAERDRSLISYFTTLIQQAVISDFPRKLPKLSLTTREFIQKRIIIFPTPICISNGSAPTGSKPPRSEKTDTNCFRL